jgi:S1-C subfamily serine protease
LKHLAILLSPLLAVAQACPALADEKIYQAILPATAWVGIKDDKSCSSGSGVLVDAARKRVLTNYHVVTNHPTVTVVFPCVRNGGLITDIRYYRDHFDALARDGLITTGRVVARDPKHDLALLELDRLPASARPLVLAAASATPGQLLHSIGNADAVPALWAYMCGHVRAVCRANVATDGDSKIDTRVVYADSPINPGDSGGPVVNARGELVALIESREPKTRCSRFIDISEIMAFLAQSAPPPPKGDHP